MKIQIISLFPQMFDGVLDASMLHKAQSNELVSFSHINLRDFGLGPRRQVDDIPYGGGDGMLLRSEPLFAAIEQAKTVDPSAIIYLMTPRGKLFDQKTARAIAELNQNMIIVCGRYEGYDERVVTLVDEQISIGNFVLTGGELPAMVLIDAVVRLLPGVLGGETSALNESFSEPGTLEYPQYTRPEEFRGLQVPKVLLSGHHQQIDDWRAEHSSKIS
jgi:tRNA (guanine37-N1)-methyltransferase